MGAKETKLILTIHNYLFVVLKTHDIIITTDKFPGKLADIKNGINYSNQENICFAGI